MKTIIVYYSMSGNTDFAAREIAARLGADTLRIEPEKTYPDKGLRKFFWGGKSAVMAETPPLRTYQFPAEAYEQVILGFPVWAGNLTPPLRTFLRDNAAALAGKRVSAFACESGSGGEKALARLREALGRPLHAELILIDPKTRPAADNDEKLRAFCGKCEDNGSHL